MLANPTAGNYCSYKELKFKDGKLMTSYNEEDIISQILSNSERQQKQLADLLEILFKQTRDCVMLLNQEKEIIYCSSNCYEITGFRASQIAGSINKFLKVVYEKDKEAVADKISDDTGNQYSIEFRIVTKDGKKRWIEQCSVPLIDSNENQFGTFITNRDISKRRKTEEKLKKSEKNLKIANADKDKFFSIIAHDLRSSFSGLIGLSQFLRNEIDDLSLPNIKELVAKINNSVKNIFAFIENILEWSRIQSGRMELHPKDFCLSDLVAEVIGLNKAVLTKKNIKIVIDTSNKINVHADENMMSVAVRNLVSNSLKFSYSGGKVWITLSEENGKVVFKIKDNGTGIRKEEMSNLFKIDTNVSKSGTENEQGTGIGLILCKEFIEKNDGKIWVESEFGKGTLFTFTLPAAKS